MVSKSKKVALGGVLSVLCLFSLYFAVYMPTNRIFFYGLSSVFSSVIMVESGAKWSWIFYGATSLLAMLLIPNKVGVIPYVLFFGLYGIIKYYIEGVGASLVRLLSKGGFFLISVALIAIAVQEIFIGEVYSKLPLWILVIISLAIFYIYDYAYTKFIIYYERVLRKKL